MAATKTSRLHQGTPVVTTDASDSVYASDVAAGRRGVVVGSHEPTGRYRVRWEDGSESVAPRERLAVAWLRDEQVARPAQVLDPTPWLERHTASGATRVVRIALVVVGAVSALWGVWDPVARAIGHPSLARMTTAALFTGVTAFILVRSAHRR